MKTLKAATALHMLFLLLDHGRFTEEEVCCELNLARATFFRALSEFRCYLTEHRYWQELQFNAKEKYYYLKDQSK